MTDDFFDKPPPARSNNNNRSPHHRRTNTKSRSPKRNNTKSRSPNHQSKSPKRNGQSRSPKRDRKPADMTVICHRIFLFDNHRKQLQHQQFSGGDSDDDNHLHYHNLPHPNLPVAPYDFCADPAQALSVAVIRAPQQQQSFDEQQQQLDEHQQQQNTANNGMDIIDTSIPNPHDPSVVHDKYWAQRRRLFSNFDMGIQLDAEGWYSVTPETIANHVAQRLVSTYSAANNSHHGPHGLIVMDAFCGCGGNAIAFGRNPHIALVVCVDVDRTKLRMAAYNACLYGIPKEKILFVECTSLFVLEHCYFDGVLRLDRLPPNNYTQVETEVSAGGFFLGGLGLLPSRIDAIFMDPPWGGVDYNSLGKNGYCLEKHMKLLKWQEIQNQQEEEDDGDDLVEEPSGALGDDFFDSFGTTSNHHNNNKKKKNKKNINFNQIKQGKCESDYWNGVDLLQVAASATRHRWVIYDLPRNTSKTSLAKCALAAGYRGNLKLEEHYLNGRLKTITAYLGVDHRTFLAACSTSTTAAATINSEDHVQDTTII